MHKKSGESIDRLLLHCKVARELLALIFSLFEVEWVMPIKVIELLDLFFFTRKRNFIKDEKPQRMQGVCKRT
jgi:hypothetical protein